jgi:HEAT repeat protein
MALAVAAANAAEPRAHRLRYYDGKTLEDWILRVKGKAPGMPTDPDLKAVERARAAGMLARIARKDKGSTRQGVPALLEALGDAHTAVRAGAAAALGEVGPVRPKVVMALSRAAEDPDSRFAACAINALRKMRHKAAPAVPALARPLHNSDPLVRKDAAEVLGSIGPDAKDAVPALAEALQDQDGMVHYAAAEATRVRYYDGRTLEEWVRQLQGKGANMPADPELAATARARAATILGQIGRKRRSEVRAVSRALINAARDKHKEVRYAALASLRQMGTGDRRAVATFIEALRDDDEQVRSIAIRALDDMGSKAQAAAPAMARTLREDPVAAMRAAAARGISHLGPAAKEVVPALATALQDQEQVVRFAAAEAVKAIGPKAQAAVPALKATLTHRAGNDAVAYVALQALGAMGPCAAEVIPTLRRVAGDQDPNGTCFVRKPPGLYGASQKWPLNRLRCSSTSCGGTPTGGHGGGPPSCWARWAHTPKPRSRTS